MRLCLSNRHSAECNPCPKLGDEPTKHQSLSLLEGLWRRTESQCLSVASVVNLFLETIEETEEHREKTGNTKGPLVQRNRNLQWFGNAALSRLAAIPILVIPTSR
jgi:hypothetical protein